MVKIFHPLRIEGDGEFLTVDAIIDIGADLTMIPSGIAWKVGAKATGETIPITGVHGQAIDHPISYVNLKFPKLKNAGGDFSVVVTDSLPNPLIGMDVLGPLRVRIESDEKELSIPNKGWEKFAKGATITGLEYLGFRILGELFWGDDFSEDDDENIDEDDDIEE